MANSLLREIQAQATDQSVRVQSVLMKSRILAARLGHDAFDDWITLELEGYPESAPLPEYRTGFRKVLFGTLLNMGYKISNVQIPMAAFPEALRDLPLDFDVRFSISTVEEFAASKDEGIRLVMPPELAQYVTVSSGGSCVELWATVPRHGFRGILNAVRDRLLEYSIEIERTNPRAGEAEPGDQPVSRERLQQIQHTVIYGSHNVVAAAGRDMSGVEVSVKAGDSDGLFAEFRRLGIDDADVRELRTALSVDGDRSSRSGLGPRVRDWLGKMLEKAASGTWTVGSQVSAQILAKLIQEYYGLRP